MRTLHISDIVIHPRQRDDVGDVTQLGSSIHRIGLIHPIILKQEGDKFVLIAGERRLTALKNEGYTELFHGVTSDPKRPGFLFYGEREPAIDKEVELLENVLRTDISWQAKVKATAEIHALWKTQSAINGVKWTQSMTGKRLGNYTDAYVSYCIALAPKVDSPEFKDCQGVVDAIKVLYKQKTDAAMQESARRMNLVQSTTPIEEDLNPLAEELPEVPNSKDIPCEVPLSSTIFKGDCIEVLAKWPDACVDHIISDPPYGIDVYTIHETASGGTSHFLNTNRVTDAHYPPFVMMTFEKMFHVFHRILRPHGYCLLWCDPRFFNILHDFATDAGFKCQNWPLVWIKTSPCLNTLAHVNFTKDYETVFVCRKADATLTTTYASSCFTAPNDAERASNVFAKPLSVWQWLYDAVSLKGQTVLDPFAGEGSSVLSGTKLCRKVLAIELEETHYNSMIHDVKAHWLELFPNAKFV